jgi:hypothetical protein
MYTDFIEVAGFVFWLVVILFLITAGAALIAQPLLWAIKRGRLAAAEIEIAQAQATAARKEAVLVRADTPNGLLPVTQEQLAQLSAAILQVHLLHQESRKPVLSSLTYSPHFRYNNDVQSQGLIAEQSSVVPFVVPSFAQVWAQGLLQPGQFLFGFADDGQPLYGDWKKIYSVALSGKPGSGKTTTERFLAVQAALLGARFVVLDPHADAGDDSLASTLAPLHAAMLCDPASEAQAIIDAIRGVFPKSQKHPECLQCDIGCDVCDQTVTPQREGYAILGRREGGRRRHKR